MDEMAAGGGITMNKIEPAATEKLSSCAEVFGPALSLQDLFHGHPI